MTIREILQRREAIRLEMRAIVDGHPDGNLPDDKATRFTALETEATTLQAAEQRQATLDAMDRRAGGAPVTETPLAEAVATNGLTREQRMVDLVSRQSGVACANLSAGRAIRAKITGDWTGAEAERRAMGESVGTTGGYMLPSPVSANIIDLVRNRSVLINAGAITIPMSNASLRVVQVTQDPVANVRAEGSAITETDGAFAALNLTAWSIAAMVRVNNELLDDAPAFAAELDTQISAFMALKLDSLGMYGTGASQPLGLRNVVGLQEVSMGDNGADQTDYDEVIDLLLAIDEANGTPAVMVQSPRSKSKLAKMKDSLSTYINASRIPDAVNALRMFTSNQISITETQGSSNAASTTFIGGFDQVAIAIRQDITIEASRVADTSFKQNQTLVRAIMRADIGVVRPSLLGRLVGIL
jgi:HK97 family phage major capsid protein